MYNISHDTLRHYDKMGILKPYLKKENGYRFYTIREIELIEIILIARQLEIPLNEIKEIIEKEDVKAYEELFARHERYLDDKINHMMRLRNKVINSKNTAHKMSKFKNSDKLDFKVENLNKKVLFFNQNGNSYVGTLDDEKNLIIILKKDENGELVSDSSIIGVELLENENINESNYTDYTIKEFTGEWYTVTRKGTLSEIINDIHKTIGREEDKEIFLESMFVINKKQENVYFVNIYISK